ncbi:MAG: Holliday junction resolvase Hjc [Candidatus Marsarchaeota archaeon]|nr:Holliday junction resolvase Hjc [Candidatus Marsarchaeota archaeon]MCL5111884.1 Holliday junction resolvase Hjc [Candidatus Marsarchaeota archaeon]
MAIQRYSKGARGERELLNELYNRGYSVVRAAGSGVNSVSPDIIAVKAGKGMVFECKAWDRGSLSIELEKYESLRRWRDSALMDTFIAWRMNGQGWFFVKLDEMTKNRNSYTVTRKNAVAKGRRLENIVL